jgi:hypothetical protein
MRIAVKMIYKRRLSGYSEILLIILIVAAGKLKFVQDPKGGGMRRLQKIEKF